MIINENDIKIFSYNFSPDICIDWYRLANGKYNASDRGEEYDHYVTEFTTHGKWEYVNSVYELLNSASSVALTGVKAPIFGNNVDYNTTASAVLESINQIEQIAQNAYDLSFSLRMTDCTFLDTVLQFPQLCVQDGYSEGREYSNITVPSYNRANATYNTIEKTTGLFSGTYLMQYDDLAQLQNFQRLNRSFAFDMPTIAGVDYPFGVMAGNIGLRAKLFSVSNIKQISSILFSVEITFVQD